MLRVFVSQSLSLVSGGKRVTPTHTKTIGRQVPDPVVNVYVGKPVADQVVEEWEVEEAALLPVFLGVREHKVQHRHHQDVDAEEDEHRVVAARPERVGEEDKDKEPSDDLEEDGEEEYDAVEESGQVLVQGAALQRRVVRSKTPRQTEKHISWSTINQIKN